MRQPLAPSAEDWRLAAAQLAGAHFGQLHLINGNSFIKMPREILWHSAQLGQGSYTAAYLAINQHGEKFALKYSFLDDASVKNELRIEEKFGLLVDSCTLGGAIIRKVPYLGIPLDLYASPTYKIFTADEAFKLIIGCLQAVLDFSYGYHSAGLPSVANCRIDRYLHRDIKPANLVVNPETMQVSAIDFGYATEADSVLGVFQSETLPGSRDYVAPELLRAKAPFVFSRNTDTYALGITLRKILRNLTLAERDQDRGWLAPIVGLSILMSAERPELRPSLESIKLTLLVWGSFSMSGENFAINLKTGFSAITDAEEAFARAVICLNANEANRFLKQENFERLMCNAVLREIISSLFDKRAELLRFIPEFLRCNPVETLSEQGPICRAYQNLKRAGLSNFSNTQRLFSERVFCEALAKPDISDENVRALVLR